MKILLLCNKSPWPPREGGPIAMNAIVEGLLKAGHQVKILAANTSKYHIDPKSIPSDYKTKTGIELVNVRLSLNPVSAAYYLLTSQSYHIRRFHNTSFERKIIEVLRKDKYDIIQCEMLYMTSYLNVIRKYSDAPVILRAHNIEHLIWKRIAANEKRPLKKWYIRQLYRTLKEYELNILNKVDAVVPITHIDADFFLNHSNGKPVVPVSFGIDPEKYREPGSLPDTFSLFTIGSMNWVPNIEGLRWFLDKAWPLVRENVPGVTFHIAGREMPAWLLNSTIPDVVIEGEVPDAWEFIQQHSCMIVPLFSGSGIRIKIIEAMSAARPVISTAIGAEGIRYGNGTHLLIARDAKSFASAVAKLAGDKAYQQQMGKQARNLILEEHNNNLIIEKLISLYIKLLHAKTTV